MQNRIQGVQWYWSVQLIFFNHLIIRLKHVKHSDFGEPFSLHTKHWVLARQIIRRTRIECSHHRNCRPYDFDVGVLNPYEWFFTKVCWIVQVRELAYIKTQVLLLKLQIWKKNEIMCWFNLGFLKNCFSGEQSGPKRHVNIFSHRYPVVSLSLAEAEHLHWRLSESQIKVV